MASKDLRSTSILFSAGIIAGPLFIVVSLFQAFSRDGFDMVRHPASLLSLGDWGWIQIADFVLSGLLFIACAIGSRRVLSPGIGRKWVRVCLPFSVSPWLWAASSLPTRDLVSRRVRLREYRQRRAGITVHGFAPILGFGALTTALFILARRFGSQKQLGWMWVTIIIGVGTLVLTSIPSFTADWESGRFNFLPLWGGVAIAYGFTSLVLAKLKGDWLAGQGRRSLA